MSDLVLASDSLQFLHLLKYQLFPEKQKITTRDSHWFKTNLKCSTDVATRIFQFLQLSGTDILFSNDFGVGVNARGYLKAIFQRKRMSHDEFAGLIRSFQGRAPQNQVLGRIRNLIENETGVVSDCQFTLDHMANIDDTRIKKVFTFSLNTDRSSLQKLCTSVESSSLYDLCSSATVAPRKTSVEYPPLTKNEKSRVRAAQKQPKDILINGNITAGDLEKLNNRCEFSRMVISYLVLMSRL